MRPLNKILITGGAGFIAPHLIRHLLVDNSNSILCIDNLVRGHEENIKEFLSNSRFQFICKDVLNLDLNIPIDTIYHLASIADYDDYMENPLDTYKVNVLGTDRILQLAERSGARVLFTSSSEVYGSSNLPVDESYLGKVDPFTIRSGYVESKRMAETLCKIYSLRGVDVVVARLFNIYGPGMEDRVIVEFYNRLIKGLPITIYGTGEQTRCFLWIDDLLAAFDSIFNLGCFGEVFNIGNPEQVTITKLASEIANICDLEVEKKYGSPRIDEPYSRIPSIEKIESLGWTPKVNLVEGLKRMLYDKKSSDINS